MSNRSTIFFLHGLGMSARLWHAVAERLDGDSDCVALDLPGHGSEAASSALTVEEMVGRVTEQIRERQPRRWALVGHSMGGKIAQLVAAGRDSLTPPEALVLVSASPLSPEPMADDVRARMIGWFDGGAISSRDAESFVDDNTAAGLPSHLRDAAVADVLAVSRDAWLAWLERGSREDWSDTSVSVPTLVLAGAKDGPLGVEGQLEHVVPRVAADGVAVIDGAAHLSPVERPDEVAAFIADHVRGANTDQLPDDVAELLASDRVSARTRGILLSRLRSPARVTIFDDEQRAALVALLDRVVPQRKTDIDLAVRLEAQLGSGVSDGWRFADLPPDIEAWRRGLTTLAGFAELSSAEQDARIEAMVAGEFGSEEAGRLTAHQMTLWFEDVRAEAVRCWLSHPAAQATIGYDGFANGGDGVRLQGYQRVGAGERDAWQLPLPGGHA